MGPCVCFFVQQVIVCPGTLRVTAQLQRPHRDLGRTWEGFFLGITSPQPCPWCSPTGDSEAEILVCSASMLPELAAPARAPSSL